MDQEDDEAKDRPSKEEQRNRSRLHELMPKYHGVESLLVCPTRGLLANPVRDGLHCAEARP